MVPMSYSGTTDLKPRITYLSGSQKAGKSSYVEVFDNKYYDSILEKNRLIQEKKDKQSLERVI